MIKDEFGTLIGGEYPYAYKYPRASLTADALVFAYAENTLKVLLIQRGQEPHKGRWAFPGGFYDVNKENLNQCACRELREETGLLIPIMEQVGVFSQPFRDPRGPVVGTAFMTLMRPTHVVGSDDAAAAKWFALSELPELAFDHGQMLVLAIRRMYEILKYQLPTVIHTLNEWTTKELNEIQTQLYEYLHSHNQ